MDQTTLSERSLVEAEIENLRSFGDSLSDEDKTVFEDLLDECNRYAVQVRKVGYSNRRFPVFLAILFAQYRRVTALEKEHVRKGWVPGY